MEELRPKITELTRWLLWAIALVAASICAIFLYLVVESTVAEMRFTSDILGVFEVLMLALIKLGFISLFFFYLANSFAKKWASLHLQNGFLEYRYPFLRWKGLQMVNLRKVGTARIGRHTEYLIRGITFKPAILFADKTSVQPVAADNEDDELEEYLLLPTGVTNEEAHRFLQKVNEEIKRVSGDN